MVALKAIIMSAYKLEAALVFINSAITEQISIKPFDSSQG